MFLCSAVPGNECQLIDTPINDFKTYHECAYYGYDYSGSLLRSMGNANVDEYKMYTAFSCKENQTI